jgi:predicted RNA-binding Zn ribbon-like protein
MGYNGIRWQTMSSRVPSANGKFMEAPFYLTGNPGIDFCNTIDHRKPPRFDMIPDYVAVIHWGQDSGILPSKENHHKALPSSKRSVARLWKARSVIHRLLLPIIHSKVPSTSDLAAFNKLSQEVASKMKIVQLRGGYDQVCGDDDPIQKILCAVVRSTADLLLTSNVGRVKTCAECGWWFLDTSRNQMRRWCIMRVCGNRAKARRHYARVRQKRASAE